MAGPQNFGQAFPFLQKEFLNPLGVAAWGYTEDLTAASFAYFAKWQQSTANPFPYLQKNPAQRHDLKQLLPAARSVLVFILPYLKAKRRYLYLTKTAPWRVSGHSLAYRGLDYHLVGQAALAAIKAKMETSGFAQLQSFAGMDTKPVLEKDLAARAKLGFIGKDGLLHTPYWGSYVFIAYLILNQTLDLPAPGNSYPPGDFGQAQACAACPGFCQQACPVGRWPGNEVGRCLAAVTIEKAVAVAKEQKLFGQILGCDLCQDACPLNQKLLKQAAPPAEMEDYQDHFPQRPTTDLGQFFQHPLREIYAEMLPLSKRGFQKKFQGTVLAYVGKDKFLAVLAAALKDH